MNNSPWPRRVERVVRVSFFSLCLLLCFAGSLAGDQLRCDSVASTRMLLSIPNVTESRLGEAKSILANWPHAFSSSLDEVKKDEATRQALIGRLRTVGDDLSQILIALILAPNDESRFPGALLPTIAADAYVNAELNDASLEAILLSRESPPLARESIAWAIATRDRSILAVSSARRHFICALSNEVKDLNPKEARLLADGLWLLNAEQSAGSRDASELLRQPVVIAARRWLNSRGYRLRFDRNEQNR